MKKFLFLLCLAYSAITTYGQTSSIPNGNFEQWTSDTFDNPQNYPIGSNTQNFFQYRLPSNVTKTTDAYHGTYAVQLTTNASATDTCPGYFLNFNPDKNHNGPSSWTGGMAYNEKPIGIRGYYKYNVATADSATIAVIFSKAGVNIGTYVFPIGGIHNTYTLFNFTFTPALTITPDSVIFAAVSCKYLGGSPYGPAGSTLKIDSVSFTGVSSQPALMNGDFELWQSQTLYSSNNWFNYGDGNGSGFSRTTDAKAGLYAMELTTYLGYKNGNSVPAANAGIVSTGYSNCNGGCHEVGGHPFSNQVDTLAFWYKYAPSANDSAQININFKKNGSFIWGKYNSLLAASTYQYVEIPFHIPGQAPDSVIIDIESSLPNDTLLSSVGSDLKIDEIHFKSQPLNMGIFNYKNENAINIFPNPANDKIQVQVLGFKIQSLEICNLLGEKVYTTSNFKWKILNEIDLSTFQKGIYFVKIYGDTKIYTKKIIIQ